MAGTNTTMVKSRTAAKTTLTSLPPFPLPPLLPSSLPSARLQAQRSNTVPCSSLTLSPSSLLITQYTCTVSPGRNTALSNTQAAIGGALGWEGLKKGRRDEEEEAEGGNWVADCALKKRGTTDEVGEWVTMRRQREPSWGSKERGGRAARPSESVVTETMMVTPSAYHCGMGRDKGRETGEREMDQEQDAGAVMQEQQSLLATRQLLPFQSRIEALTSACTPTCAKLASCQHCKRRCTALHCPALPATPRCCTEQHTPRPGATVSHQPPTIPCPVGSAHTAHPSSTVSHILHPTV